MEKSEVGGRVRERERRLHIEKKGALWRVLVPGIADASTQLEVVAVGVV